MYFKLILFYIKLETGSKLSGNIKTYTKIKCKSIKFIFYHTLYLQIITKVWRVGSISVWVNVSVSGFILDLKLDLNFFQYSTTRNTIPLQKLNLNLFQTIMMNPGFNAPTASSISPPSDLQQREYPALLPPLSTDDTLLALLSPVFS